MTTELIGEAHDWLGRFAPLVELGNAKLTAEEQRALAESLLSSGASLRDRLSENQDPESGRLQETVSLAIEQIQREFVVDSTKVDVEAIRSRLLQEHQQHEVKEFMGDVFERTQTDSPSYGGGCFMILFGLAFTIVPIGMLTGDSTMANAFPAGFAGAVIFFGVFIVVGLLVVGQGLQSMGSQSIQFEGRTLIVARETLGTPSTTRYDLPPDARAEVITELNEHRDSDSSRTRVTTSRFVAIPLGADRSVKFAAQMLPAEQQRLADRINKYLDQVSN